MNRSISEFLIKIINIINNQRKITIESNSEEIRIKSVSKQLVEIKKGFQKFRHDIDHELLR